MTEQTTTWKTLQSLNLSGGATARIECLEDRDEFRIVVSEGDTECPDSMRNMFAIWDAIKATR
jgi:hypothetical protein